MPPIDDAVHISEFDTTLPPGTDPAAEGNENFHHFKQVMKTSLPNIDSPMTATSAQMNSWDGRIAAFESGANAMNTPEIFDLVLPVGTIYWTEYDQNLPTFFTDNGTWEMLQAASELLISDPGAPAGNPGAFLQYAGDDGTLLNVRNMRAWLRTA